MLKNKKGIAVLAVAALAAAGLFLTVKPANAEPQMSEANSTPVETMDITSSVYASGTVQITESRNLRPETKGHVTALNIAVGDKVDSGQILAEIDSSELSLSLERKALSHEIEKESLNQTLMLGTASENADLEKAQLSYESAKQKFESNKVLYASGSISEKDYKDSESSMNQEKINLDTAKKALNSSAFDSKVRTHKLNIQLIESEIAEIKSKIEKQKIISPISGTVTEINYKKGEMYDEEKSLIKVQNLDTKEIKTLISEGEINKLALGSPVSISASALKGQQVTGTVMSISPGTTKKEGKNQAYTEVIVAFTQPTDLLRDGFLVNLTIETETAENAKAVSFEAVRKDLDGKATVSKLGPDGEVIDIPVEVGVEGDLYVQIISDLIQVGDELLIDTPAEEAYPLSEEAF